METNQEVAIIAGLVTGSGQAELLEAERSLDELAELATAAGAQVAARVLQKRQTTEPAYYIGKGKLEEIRQAARELNATLLIFDDELSGSQIRNIETMTDLKVIDRTFLILDIFAQRAQSREGKLQVELAQQQYRLSRLVGLGLSLSRLGGGIGTRGPGESQLESDRRHINRRILFLKRSLLAVSQHRERTRQQRRSHETTTVAVVGYTNAGKTTLMNRLCATDLLAMDQVFATLDPAARRLELPDQQTIILIDTVGFIRKLPHHLVDAFRSTLEEVSQADLIMHVVDVADPDAENQVAVVEKLLVELKAAGKPRLTVLNKVDQLDTLDPALVSAVRTIPGQKIVKVSALTGQGVDELLQALGELSGHGQVAVSLLLPYAQAGMLRYIEQNGQLEKVEYQEEGIAVDARIRSSHLQPLVTYRRKNS
jgi:GTP-binding protein HflX